MDLCIFLSLNSACKTSTIGYYFVNDFTVKEYLGYEMTRPFPDLVLFNCPWHPKVELIARYDGRIEIAPSGRYRRIGMITTP
jgi:hypothetical protein